MSDVRQYEDLRGDGRIVLFLREGKKPKYYVRLKLPNSNGYKTISTKTSDRNEGVRVSMDLYDEYYHKVKMGGKLYSKTYKEVFDEWRKQRSNSYSNSKLDGTVERVGSYSLDYFGSFKIDKISAKNFYEYWDWRKLNFKRKKPSDDTLNRERTSIQSLLKFSLQRGYITEAIEVPKLKTKGISKRPTFTLNEWKIITTKMRKWVEEGRPLGKWRDRYILQQYVLLMSNSGVRVGEMRGVKWEDISSVQTDEGIQLVIRVNGKVGERDVVLNPSSDVYVKRLYDLRISELDGVNPPSNEYVFLSRRTNKPMTSFKKSFNSMLEYCGIPTEKNGLNRTIYSLRHFYGTQRLRGDINPYHLSKQMGTSVEMIEKFYGHILTKDVIDSVQKSVNQKSSNIKPKTDYPFL
jgi:integrase